MHLHVPSSFLHPDGLRLAKRTVPAPLPSRWAITKPKLLPVVRATSLNANEVHAEYMKLCLSLAREALGHTSPNPMVGCVLVKDGRIIGKGFHPRAGQPHAEVFALRDAGDCARGATAYVSLEPCNHFGRTPPCTSALIEADVKQVVVGMLDPNPLVAGKGVEKLRDAVIEVLIGVEEAACQVLNEAYIHRMLQKRPFVTLRFSSSLDGRFLGSYTMDCGQGSYFSKLLQENDAIIIPDAAVYDNPTLISKEPGAKQPLRIILTDGLDFLVDDIDDIDVFDTLIAPTLVIASERAILADAESSWKRQGQTMEHLLHRKGVQVVTLKDLDLASVLNICYERGFSSVLVDSRSHENSGFGNSLSKQALEANMVQKLVAFISPLICGNTRNNAGFNVEKDVHLINVTTKMSGQCVIVESYLAM